MALELPGYVKPETGALSEHAYLKIVDATLEMAPHRTSVTAWIYHSKATSDAGLKPVTEVPPITLPANLVDSSNPEFVQALVTLVQEGQITSPRDALTACLYVLLKAYSYPTALDV